ncbi:MAG: polyprenyl diphosphate synthase, partial [Pseudomonadota bacterium]
MDGNGRWAQARGMPRTLGHKAGVEAVRRTVKAAPEYGINHLTLYAFSSENWKRSEDEVDDLMNLMRRFIKSDLPEFVANGVKLKIIGDWQSLAPDIVAMLEDALAQTAGGHQTLAVALNYGGQHEIARAAAKAAKQGEVTTDAIEVQLDTADLPPLDLLIRTSGEVRLSNFLLWQAAYAEMLFVDTLWPDFKPEHLAEALDQFHARERRYGGR